MRGTTTDESSGDQTGGLNAGNQEENLQEPKTQSKERQHNSNPDEPTIGHPYEGRSTPYLEDSPEEEGYPPPDKPPPNQLPCGADESSVARIHPSPLPPPAKAFPNRSCNHLSNNQDAATPSSTSSPPHPFLASGEPFTLDRYAGETDPDEHLKVYIIHVALYTYEDVVFCKAFPPSLEP